MKPQLLDPLLKLSKFGCAVRNMCVFAGILLVYDGRIMNARTKQKGHGNAASFFVSCRKKNSVNLKYDLVTHHHNTEFG